MHNAEATCVRGSNLSRNVFYELDRNVFECFMPSSIWASEVFVEVNCRMERRKALGVQTCIVIGLCMLLYELYFIFCVPPVISVELVAIMPKTKNLCF